MATLPRAKKHSQTAHHDDTKPTTLRPGNAARKDGNNGESASASDGASHDGSQSKNSRDGKDHHDGADHAHQMNPSASGANRSGDASGRNGGASEHGTRAAPYTHQTPVTQPHAVVPLATRDEQGTASAQPGQRRSQAALGVALAIGVAAAAFWLERRK